MQSRFTLYCVLALLCLAGPGHAAGPATVAVVDFTSSARTDLVRTIPDLLIDELVNTGQFDIVEREKLDAIRTEQNFQASGLVGSNVAALGAMAGADYLVTGSIIDIGTRVDKVSAYGTTTYTAYHRLHIGVKFLDVKTGKVVLSTKKKAERKQIGRASRSGYNAPIFAEMASSLVRRVVGKVKRNSERFQPSGPAQPQLVSVSIDSQPAGADVEIDGVFYGNAGGEFAIEPGLHQIRVSLSGHKPWEKKVMIRQPMSFTARLSEDVEVQRLEITTD